LAKREKKKGEGMGGREGGRCEEGRKKEIG